MLEPLAARAAAIGPRASGTRHRPRRGGPRERGDRLAAARPAAETRLCGRLAPARRSSRSRRRCRRGGPGARALPQGGDQGSAIDGSGRVAGRERTAAGRGALALPSCAAPDRRRGAAHARGGGGAPAPVRGRANSARALPRTRPELRCGPPQLRSGAQPAGKGGGGAAAGGGTAGEGAPQSGVSEPQGGGARESRRLRRVDRGL